MVTPIDIYKNFIFPFPSGFEISVVCVLHNLINLVIDMQAGWKSTKSIYIYILIAPVIKSRTALGTIKSILVIGVTLFLKGEGRVKLWQ